MSDYIVVLLIMYVAVLSMVEQVFTFWRHYQGKRSALISHKILDNSCKFSLLQAVLFWKDVAQSIERGDRVLLIAENNEVTK